MNKSLVILSFFLVHSYLFAQIDSQWRGEKRDGKYNGENLLKSWPADGPALIATLEGIGDGYSSPAVTTDRIYVTGMQDGTGYLFAFDLSGKQLWKKVYANEWDTRFPGSRVTPTVVGDKIYLSSSLSLVFCFNSLGEKVWTVDMRKEYNAPNIKYGVVESILIDGEYAFCTPGSEDVSILVLNKNSGEVIKKIKTNGGMQAYCSPHIINHNGRRIFVTMLSRGLIGIDMKSLEVIFEHEHITKNGTNPNTPLYYNGYLYIVSGYGTGGQLLQLSEDGIKVTQVWKDSELDNQMGASILVDDHIYGSGHRNKYWYCIEFMTGEVKYSSRELGRKGSVIFADDLLYIYGENGDIGIVKPNSERFEIVSSFKLEEGSGEHFAHPVIKNGRLYVRHGNILNIYNIAG